MRLEIRSLQIPRGSWVHEPLEDWLKKIGHFEKISSHFVRQDQDLLKGLDGRDLVICLDERGESPDSRQFARRLQVWLESGKARLIFLVGGPFGLPKEALQRADAQVSLSHFVFNQELALAVLAEQIFRALTILNNHPYHND